MTEELHYLSIAEAGRRIAARTISPVELAQAYLRRIESLDPQIHAFITLTADPAMKEARQAESEIAAGQYRGPMHGIPFGLKDVIDSAGILTSGHSKIAIDRIPAEDATATARLHRAGGVLIGKLSTFEFAAGGPSFDLPWPPALNPWTGGPLTGGSSTGSAAALAAGFLPGALGTDTGGSIRTPASQAGVVGLKPTYGLVSRFGVITHSFTFDHCGPMTWTVEDCAIMLQAIAGYDPRDPGSADRPVPDYRAALSPDLRGMRIGVIRHFWEEDLPANDEVCRAMDATLDVLAQLGAKLEDTRMRPPQDYYDVKNVISESEIFAVHQKDLAERPGDYGADFLGRALVACLFQATDYIQAQRERRRMLLEMLPLYEKYDVLLTGCYGPALFRTSAAPPAAAHKTTQDSQKLQAIDYFQKWEKPSITTPFSVTGGPALVLCNGFTQGGLPLAMQVVGRPFDEASVFKVGHAYEQATPWKSRRPALVAGRTATAKPPAPRPTHALASDEPMRRLVEPLAERAGLKLTEPQLAQLCGVAPYALAMARRIRRDSAWADEPANAFRFPNP